MLLWLAISCVALSVAVLLLLIFNGVRMMLSVNHSSLDPKSNESGSYASLFDPFIIRGGRILLPLMTWSHRTRLDKTLMQAGVTSFEHHHFFFVQFLISGLFMICAMLIMIPILWNRDITFANVVYLIVAGLSGFFLPLCWLHSKAQNRREEILRTLPFFMDMLALGLNAGMSLQSALQMTLKHLEEGPLKAEWSRFLFDVRSGFTRAHALRQLSARIDVSAVRQFVAALIQGEAMGLSLTRTVLEYGKQLRTMRLLRAEKLAFQAPVKMLFPLAFFIFPCTFLILGFPVLAPVLGVN